MLFDSFLNSHKEKNYLNPDFGLGFFYFLDNYCELVYTYSVVNREVIRNVVDML